MKTFENVEVRADGDANFYHLTEKKRWIAVVQLNGEFTVAQQEVMMKRIADALRAPQADVTDEQYVAAARSTDSMAELCSYSEYDPDVGQVPGHWKPKYPDFARAILLAAKDRNGTV